MSKLIVKDEFLNHKPPHCSGVLGEFSQRQLKSLPEKYLSIYCHIEEKKKVKKHAKIEKEV